MPKTSGWTGLAFSLFLPLAVSLRPAIGAELPPATLGNLAITALPAADLASRGIEPLALGDLEAPTGHIVVADPLVQPDRQALARAVPPGRYPVMLYKAQGRIAMALLRLAPGTVTHWEIAVLPGQDPATLKPDEIFGYPVDTGLGCFMDVEAAKAMATREALQKARQQNSSRPYDNYYDDVLANELSGDNENHVMHRPLAPDPANVAVFQSGWGDGFYASYWGLDDSGKALALVTDFEVIENGDGRSDYGRYKIAALGALTPQQQDDSRAAYKAMQEDDLKTLQALLASGRVTPETWVMDAGSSFSFETIRLDKPAALELLVRYGAVMAMPKGLLDGTYADWARSFAKHKDNPKVKPRSPELMEVIRRWEAGEIALADDAPVRTAK
ncbi:hypothetical protein GCM10007874_29680 [Labrys miyagiensis]|uniref:DUF4241 domain-containing protein n=1 Tax=Labrys miyagiensis TaxID=346912 RepID=A0ABQ6CIA0_9HYPH|nr:DUF4241 domain-containing protein [Labrys miyagiensis]GLS19951.1 hypothetical protein GCM10007874_29680 [Labrys miyagiensis]